MLSQPPSPTPSTPSPLPSFLSTLSTPQVQSSNAKDRPSFWLSNPSCLHSTSTRLHTFLLGTGSSIYSSLASSISSVDHELVLITCFWARSASFDTLISSLHALSDKAIARGANAPKIKVFIGLSSLSLFQKLLQTGSSEGKIYNPEEYESKLWLPHPKEFPGLDITVKSIFVRPFSVMHPKFILLDRKIAWLPSCNVSWEEWFEGAVSVSGKEIVGNFINFYEEFWLCKDFPLSNASDLPSKPPTIPDEEVQESKVLARIEFDEKDAIETVETFFLPSPHHRNPRFFPLPWLSTPPPTPLNTFLLQMLNSSRKHIFMQSPNFTCATLLNALKKALQRGLSVHIRTSSNLMVLEQLVTAWTTTSRCMDNLVSWYRHEKLTIAEHQKKDPEAPKMRCGRLWIEYFTPLEGTEDEMGQPVQSHIKMSVFDDETTVLGSGNMDRASWYTSQELGVAFKSRDIAKRMIDALEGSMRGRTTVLYDSDDGKGV